MFTYGDIVAHTSQTSKKFTKKKGEKSDACSSVFIQKMEWMGECEKNTGKIVCEMCLNKLGEYNWSGRQCSCGKFVTPAFQIHKSTVDEQLVSNSYISRPKKWD